MSNRAKILAILVAGVLVTGFLVSSQITIPTDLKPLGVFYINQSMHGNYSAKSPEAVTAIVWDYRGIDTLFETLVLFLAIVGGIAVFEKEIKGPVVQVGLTDLSKTSTRIVVVLIAIVSASIALHGHLTPGGGFQGGSTLAVATLLLIPVFGYGAILRKGITSTKLVVFRGLALTGIGIVAVLPVVRGLEVASNTSFYPYEIQGILTSGNLFLYNLLEYVAVGVGFTAVFLYLSLESGE